ncbi:hypothetical protein [Candidatus Protochlamydia phocaeensis]|uniref:hypothetical protein n=1 Tax=Candidatus Protochlamydia phocaeensis TaxID=1414722 RepID=UPI0008390C3D|nr:hypothetical protein [Candidatus Protochlamydia phocaeensis]
MPRKRSKELPPGTFIPFPQRLLAIIQLCLAFSLILWYATQPFMGEYFSLRSRMLLYEYVMGNSEIVKKQLHQEDKLQRQAQRFARLPQAERQKVLEDYQALHLYATRPALKKIEDGLRALFLEVPPFELAWLCFSVVIAVLLLLKVEGAKQAAWLLPLITLTFALDNRLNGHPSYQSPDYALFPTESFLIEHYLKEPLGHTPSEQKEQLQKGWEQYLVEQWSPPLLKEGISGKQQLEEAEYAFTLARLDRLHGQAPSNWLVTFREQLSSFRLALYLAWNLFFAWMMNRSNVRSSVPAVKRPS